MTNEELREKAGRMLYEGDPIDDRDCPWGNLSEDYRELWRKDAWRIVQLGLAAGLREAAGMCRADASLVREEFPDMPEEESHESVALDIVAMKIEARAKEVKK